ncbi:hypothetical protein MHYP_G00023440 [Metynnis hypsauchen]
MGVPFLNTPEWERNEHAQVCGAFACCVILASFSAGQKEWDREKTVFSSKTLLRFSKLCCHGNQTCKLDHRRPFTTVTQPSYS